MTLVYLWTKVCWGNSPDVLWHLYEFDKSFDDSPHLLHPPQFMLFHQPFYLLHTQQTRLFPIETIRNILFSFFLFDHLVRSSVTPDHDHHKKLDCTTDKNSAPAPNGVDGLSLSGQSGYLDCFVQLFNKKNEGISNDKVIENNKNAMTAMTAPPNVDSKGEKLSDRESRRVSMNLRLNFRNGYVVQPDWKQLDVWRIGKDVGGTIRWLEQSGTQERATEEAKRRSHQPTSNWKIAPCKIWDSIKVSISQTIDALIILNPARTTPSIKAHSLLTT